MPAFGWEMLDEQTEGPFVIGGQLSVIDPAAIDLQMAFCGDKADDPSSYYALTVEGLDVSFTKVLNGKTERIGTIGHIPQPGSDATVEIALHRDAWRMAFIWDGRVVAKAFDTTLSGSAVGYQATGGIQVEDVWLQLLGEVSSGDSFERTEEEDREQSKWDTSGGKWSLISLREDTQKGQMQADKAANAFSYYCVATKPSLATLGSWFWRNCSYSMAARARGDEGAFGLAFYAQDPQNYLLLRWDNRCSEVEGGPTLRLVARVDGAEQTLAQRPGGFFPDQWYQLRVDVCDDRVFCFVDDQPVLTASVDLFGQGKVGLYAEGRRGTWFDDVKVRDWSNMVEQFGTQVPGKWASVKGRWSIDSGSARPLGTEASLLLTGARDWANYEFSTRMQGASAGCGVAVCWRDSSGYVFRWAAQGAPVPYAGKAQLVALSDGDTNVLAEEPLANQIPEGVVATVVAESDYIAGLLNGRRVIDAAVPGPIAGAVGLYSEGSAEVAFATAQLRSLPQRRMARVTKEFTDSKEHFEMVEWASTRHNWIKPDDKRSPNTWWTKGDYFGSLQLQFRLTRIGTVQGTMKIAIESDPANPQTGYTLSIVAKRGTKDLALALSKDGEPVAKAQVTAKGSTCPISVERRGRQVLVAVDDVDGKVVMGTADDRG